MTGDEKTSADVWAWFEDVRRLEVRGVGHDEAVKRAERFHGFVPDAYARERAGRGATGEAS